MSSQPVRTLYDIRRFSPECQLPHHRPGSWVKFTEWDTVANRMAVKTGRVVSHERRQLVIDLDFGARVSTSCGHVTRAGEK